MCIAQEKRELCELENKLRKRVALQWKMLRDTVTQPIMFAFMIHPESWGHSTKSWKRANLPPPTFSQQQQCKNHPVIPAPPTIPHRQAFSPDKVGPPPILPPRVMIGDAYENISTILTYNSQNEEENWEVHPDELSEGTSHDDDKSDMEISQEVYAQHIQYEEGDYTNMENHTQDFTMQPVFTEQPVFTKQPVFTEQSVFTEQPDLIEQQDVQEVNFTRMSDYLYEYYDRQGNSRDDDLEATESQVQQEVSSYNEEFTDFYDRYEEGADFLYYEDYGDKDVPEDPDEG